MNITLEDKQILRALAERYMSHALSPRVAEKRELWRRHNALDMQKPMVAIDQMPWNELDVDGFLNCKVENPFFRGVEWNLRTEIYKYEHLPVDMVLNPYILIPRPIGNTDTELQTRRLLSRPTKQATYTATFSRISLKKWRTLKKFRLP